MNLWVRQLRGLCLVGMALAGFSFCAAVGAVATAGYASAHAAKVWGFTPELAILFGTFASTALGVVTGLLAIRR